MRRVGTESYRRWSIGVRGLADESAVECVVEEAKKRAPRGRPCTKAQHGLPGGRSISASLP